jgi:formylglycine-generating enzyme required for sulfatase activity/energy-coupling factor transporter ATP-binding protein EcfA2
VAAGEGATIIQESIIVNAEKGARVAIGTEPVKMSSKLRATALGRYLEHIIAHNRYLQLQGIRSGGKLVNIELEHIYITLRTTQQRNIQAEEEWLHEEAGMAPGEMGRMKMERSALRETVSVTVDQALADNKHMVILGDPGSGKTTLLRYLALLYGRDLAESTKSVSEKLKLNEAGYLPVLLQLRQFGSFLKEHYLKDDGTEGHGLLFEFLFRAMKGFRIDLPDDFFDAYFQNGKAIILLDGMDEVADPDLRARVARMLEAFTLAYPKCRFVITSRVVGYTGASRLTGDYVTTTVRDFTLADVEQFLKHWHRLVAVGQLGPGESADTFASSQTTQLMSAIRGNERIRDLAINPLLLTVIALVHRDRVKLPDRRAELYAEAVDVLLGKWDEARGVGGVSILEDRPFEVGDKRLMLQSLALWMHEHEQKEISQADLFAFLEKQFSGMAPDLQKRRMAIERFQRVIEERTGLLSARGEGVYAFSHLTFQEYLAARALSGRDDYVEYALRFTGGAWWREVILLEAGHLSGDSIQRASRLIRAIMEYRKEPLPYHNLVLASECLRDAGEQRVDAKLSQEINDRLDKALKSPPPATTRIFKKWGLRTWIDQRAGLAQSLARAGKGYWTQPFGEPDWVTIPAGEFWMGVDVSPYERERPQHKLFMPEYQIARVPVTNAQYALFIQDAKYKAPEGWEENRPPKGRESHPVVNVSWYDAIKYCEWLTEKTGKSISLPSEAEWEKAARSDDKREYPWGKWESYRANTNELGLGDTTPVGIFLEGASPYGVLDMSGNVWEWTRSIFGRWDKKNNKVIEPFAYPYLSNDGREKIMEDNDLLRTLRGGAFYNLSDFARCSFRSWFSPVSRPWVFGFRVVVSPVLPSRL